jgi:hypothetical protein
MAKLTKNQKNDSESFQINSQSEVNNNKLQAEKSNRPVKNEVPKEFCIPDSIYDFILSIIEYRSNEITRKIKILVCRTPKTGHIQLACKTPGENKVQCFTFSPKDLNKFLALDPVAHSEI